MASVRRTYHDPLHGAIALDGTDPVEALLIGLIDTPAFQRLRRIRQLGPASLTFHGAESSRFTHSLGVMAIARRAFDRIAKRYPQLIPHRATVLCAALLHDIGHGPFSHTCEEIFGCHHEHWTLRILQESDPVRKLLDGFDRELLPDIAAVLQKRHPIPLVWQLVSSQLDCDRLDYLMRDSYFTGASYGKLDLDRILMAMNYDPDSQQLVVARKGMTAIEHYLIVRYFMYAQVYNHPKNIAATWILEHIFKRAKELIQANNLEADEIVTAWLQENCNDFSLQQYLEADDGVFMYHLHRWKHHSDLTLSDLCRRFLDRDLFKAIDISALTDRQQQELLQQVRSELMQLNFPSENYAGIRVAVGRGYTLYQRGIKLQTENGLLEISEQSPLVKTLANTWQQSWLIYPRDVAAPALLKQFNS
ncbi:MAG TPA: HD domain-containing protein [Synechococcales cyanobacterium M55_K2018_004]|nr:HD domain-containing protein [Synechococcales cyanobacterium M55_K2018_004]